MKFYMTPGSCSTGIHVLLEELELFFEAHLVDLMAGDHLKPALLTINPRATIPTLVLDDGTALTDFQSIALWLAATYPKKQLLSADDDERARDLEVMGYAVKVIHGEGFTRIFATERYSVDGAEQSIVAHEGREIVEHGFARLDRWLSGSSVPRKLSIADAAVFYVEFWADRIGIAMPPSCQAHYHWMLGRRAVRQVLAEEGYGSTLRKYPVPGL